jgi:hypothetical protein
MKWHESIKGDPPHTFLFEPGNQNIIFVFVQQRHARLFGPVLFDLPAVVALHLDESIN